MRIVQLKAENFKRLTAVEITPDGNVISITGRNGQGKSSVLDAIWWALGGREGAKGMPQPVRSGADGASVEIDLGDLIVTRTAKASGTSSLKVAAKDGASYSSPQSMLDGLIGKMCFDPLAFTRMDTKDQVAQLTAVVDLPFNVDELAAKRRGAFERRTDVNRDLKSAQARLAATPPAPEGTPTTEVSASTLIAARDEAAAANAENARKREAKTRAEGAVTAADQQVENLQRQLAAAEQHRTFAIAEARDSAAAVEGLVDVDLSVFQTQLDELEQTNAAVRTAKARELIEREVAEYEKASQQLTDEITALDAAKAEGLAAADMPVDGLGWDENGVTLDGIPFSQASTARQIQVSTAIAMASNPDIRVIRIADGSLLDSASLQIIEEMAGERDYQVWIERVSETGDMGVVIEDGAIAVAAGAT